MLKAREQMVVLLLEEVVALAGEHDVLLALLGRYERVADDVLGRSYATETRPLLRFHLVGALRLMKDAAEVGDNDGHGQRDHQHTGHRAYAADDLAERGLGHNVAVAERGERHYRVPEGLRYAAELGVLDILLAVVDDGGEDHDGYREREDHEAELVDARLERLADDLEALRMSRKLEYAKDAKDAQRDERAAQIVVLDHDEADVVGQYGDHVDDAHRRERELDPIGRRVQAQEVLDGEEYDAGGVEREEDLAVAFAQRLQLVRLDVELGVEDAQRLGYVGQHAHGDEEGRHVVEHERHRARLRILEGVPHLLAQSGRHGRLGVGHDLLVEEALVGLALLVAVLLVAAVAHEVGQDAEEGQLLLVGVDALGLGVVEAPGAVEIEYVTEELRVAVQEVLVGLLVVEEVLLDRAEQRLRILLQRRLPALELVAADVDDDLLVGALLLLLDGRQGQRVF